MHFKKIFNPLKRVSNSVRRSLVKRDLADLLKEANPVAPLAVKVLWLEQIFSWIRSSTDFSHEFDETTGGIHNVRIRFILHLLEKNPEWKRAFIQTVREILRQTSM